MQNYINVGNITYNYNRDRKKENNNMFGFDGIFNGMFKPVARGLCKIGVNGKVAIKTSSGYKTFDLKKKQLVNCDNFGFDMDGAFFVVPTFKVEVGDIILVNGKPKCVMELHDSYITTFSYEDSTIDQIVPEHYVFMGKTYCYGKIFSPFMNMEKSSNAMQSMMNMMMMSQMFGGNNNTNSNGMNPMMFMMMMNGDNKNPFTEMFEGAFNFGLESDEEENTKEDK